MRIIHGHVLLAALTAATLAAAVVTARAETAPAATKVSYVAGGSVYAGVGALDGVQPGDTVQVLHDGTQVALLKVSVVASHRASCDTLWTHAPVAVGDELRYRPHDAPKPVDGAPPRPFAAGQGGTRQRHARLRGRVGASWLSVQAGGVGFQQPGLDLRLDGFDAGGGHVDLSFDMRNRRTVRTGFGTSSTTELSRVYRAALVVRSVDSHQSVTIGRQTSASLSSVSLFDGVLAQTGNERHAFGVFSGTEPDPTSYAVSRDIVQSGAFMDFHSPLASERRAQVSLGAITSQEAGQPNRDFMFALANWSARQLSSTFTQEVDWNRGWKRALGEPAITPTSTFWTARYAPVTWFGASTGFDNRRNVRLYRDRITPADQFDDAYRQGAWVGSDASVLGRLHVSGEVRGSGAPDRSSSWSVGAEAYRLGVMHLTLNGRASRFGGSGIVSRLWSAGFGVDPSAFSHLSASGGVRSTIVSTVGTWDTQDWGSMDLDVTLGRRWYANGSYERDQGGSGGDSQQVQAGLSWRF